MSGNINFTSGFGFSSARESNFNPQQRASSGEEAPAEQQTPIAFWSSTNESTTVETEPEIPTILPEAEQPEVEQVVPYPIIRRLERNNHIEGILPIENLGPDKKPHILTVFTDMSSYSQTIEDMINGLLKQGYQFELKKIRGINNRRYAITSAEKNQKFTFDMTAFDCDGRVGIRFIELPPKLPNMAFSHFIRSCRALLKDQGIVAEEENSNKISKPQPVVAASVQEAINALDVIMPSTTLRLVQSDQAIVRRDNRIDGITPIDNFLGIRPDIITIFTDMSVYHLTIDTMIKDLEEQGYDFQLRGADIFSRDYFVTNVEKEETFGFTITPLDCNGHVGIRFLKAPPELQGLWFLRFIAACKSSLKAQGIVQNNN